MQSQLTVRLPDDLDRKVSAYAKRLRLKRSDIVRMALEKFVEETFISEELSPYKRVSNLIGIVESGVSDFGQSHRKHLLKKMRKHA